MEAFVWYCAYTGVPFIRTRMNFIRMDTRMQALKYTPAGVNSAQILYSLIVKVFACFFFVYLKFIRQFPLLYIFVCSSVKLIIF